jgi:hypothetical protein
MARTVQRLPQRSAERLMRLLPVLLLLLLARPDLAAGATNGYQALLPAYQDDLETRFGDRLIGYDIDIRFRPSEDRITGSMTVDLPNTTGQPLAEIAFRLFPNALYYGEGYLAITRSLVNGADVVPAYEANSTVMLVPLDEPLAPGERVEIELGFRTVIPDDSKGTFGIFSHAVEQGAWVLADWYPIVAGWDAELGWRVDPPTPAGDPTYADAATYDLTITVPDDLTVIAGGQVTAELDTGSTTTRSIVTGPSRDLTMVITDRLSPLNVTAGETDVRVWAEPNGPAQTAAAWVSELAGETLVAYGDRYGDYPYTELDLVSTPVLQSVLGVSWTGLIMLSDVLLLSSPAWIEDNPDTARFAVIHEVGHEWWGNMIGANSNDHPFMVEGLTNAVTIDIVADLYGAEAATRMLYQQIVWPYQAALSTSGDGIVNQPVGSESPAGPGRVALAYGKGALGFLAIRVALGDEAYFAALADYADRFLYANGEPADLLATFEAHAPAGVDVATVWDEWFERAGTTEDDIEQVVSALVARL